MKKVAILTNYLESYQKNEFYFESEKLLKEVLFEHNIELVYVTHYYYDKNAGHFTEHVRVGNSDMKMCKEPYTPDLVWVKTPWTLEYLTDLFKDAPFVLTPTLRLKKIESDKYQMFRYLEKFQPYTMLLTSYYFYLHLQKKFGDMVVVKPVTGSGGYGINFYTKDEIASMDVFEKYKGMEALHIVQDYKNFSHGYPGIVEGNHDLRVAFLGDMPSFSVIRSPQKGSLKSNVASGGRQFSIPLKDVPKQVMEMCKEIQESLKVSPFDSYSFDFGYCLDEDKWYLIEINSAPGIWFPDEDLSYQYKFFHDLGTYFSTLLLMHGHDDHHILDEEHYRHLLP